MMKKGDKIYDLYVGILKEELVPAMGCTEPIAVAYAAAKAREVLGAMPERIRIQASGSIIKNVKSVIVPNTNHLKGLEAAAAAGVIAGKANKKLEVIAEVEEDEIQDINEYLSSIAIDSEFMDNGIVFDLIVTVWKGDSSARVRIADTQTNIVLIEKTENVFTKKNRRRKAAGQALTAALWIWKVSGSLQIRWTLSM